MTARRGEAKAWLDTFLAEANFGEECIIWPYARSSAGYAFIGRPIQLVHRVVCAAVHGPCPDGLVARHGCGRGHDGCINPNHLRWGTRSQNQLDRRDHGTDNGGEKHPLSKLTNADVHEIRSSDETAATIADRLGISPHTVQDIRAGRRWATLPLEHPADRARSDDEVQGSLM